MEVGSSAMPDMDHHNATLKLLRIASAKNAGEYPVPDA